MSDLSGRLLGVIVLVLSLSVHEWAHAATAVWLGDDRPIRDGRYTLNPIAHIDPIGTILLPLLGAPIGWAKPVVWDPRNVRRDIPIGRATWMVSLAGPFSNLVIALVAALAYVLTYRYAIASAHLIRPFAAMFLQMNVGLAIFNMLPLPPLDGSRIVDVNVPRSFESQWALVHRYAPFIFIGLILLNSQTHMLEIPIALAVNGLLGIAAHMVGVPY